LAAVAFNPGVIDTPMLRQVWGDRAAAFWAAGAWTERAATFLVALAAEANGRSLSLDRSAESGRVADLGWGSHLLGRAVCANGVQVGGRLGRVQFRLSPPLFSLFRLIPAHAQC
jgi:hypothetical protein